MSTVNVNIKQVQHNVMKTKLEKYIFFQNKKKKIKEMPQKNVHINIVMVL